MQCSDTAKPATASYGEPAPGIVGSGGRNNHLDTKNSLDLQVSRLTRLYAVNGSMAETYRAPRVFGGAAVINNPGFLVCQVQAVTEFAVSHHKEDDLRELLDGLLAACAQIEHAIAWRKIHGGDAA